jgi:hypothetical protein
MVACSMHCVESTSCEGRKKGLRFEIGISNLWLVLCSNKFFTVKTKNWFEFFFTKTIVYFGYIGDLNSSVSQDIFCNFSLQKIGKIHS